MPTNSSRRGLFRIWLVLLSLALMIVPCWYVYTGMKMADHSCFDLLAVTPTNSLRVSSDDLIEPGEPSIGLPAIICTEPSAYDDPQRRALERSWMRLTSVSVKLADKRVQTFQTAALHGSTDLLVKSDMTFERVAFWSLVRDFWMLEVAVVVAFGVIWWIGRLTAAVILWVCRGFTSAQR